MCLCCVRKIVSFDLVMEMPKRVKKTTLIPCIELARLRPGVNDKGALQYYCPFCAKTLNSSEALPHVMGWKHFRRRRWVEYGNPTLQSLSKVDDEISQKLSVILIVGDCHGGRCINPSFSPLVRSYFFGGSIYSWACRPQRTVPPLTDLLPKRDSRPSANKKAVAVIWSYGEVDVRCHSSMWFRNSRNEIQEKEKHRSAIGDSAVSLARAYINKVQKEIEKCTRNLNTRVITILLAVPPASNQGENKRVPFVGSLETRVSATEALNEALHDVCLDTEPLPNQSKLFFSGKDTWRFAMIKESEARRAQVTGSLNPDISDGHVHVRPEYNGPVHRLVREILEKELNEI